MAPAVIDTFIVDAIKVSTLKFTLPLDHARPAGAALSVVAKVVNNYKYNHNNNNSNNHQTFDKEKDISNKVILFLQGGPGFPSVTPTSRSTPPFLQPLLARDYTVILLDQRGTGLSTPLDADLILSKGTDAKGQFEFIKHFRADSIVNDCELIRKQLLQPDAKWSLLGQSFGGFTSISYMSMYPESLSAVFLTGGLAPIQITSVDDVYHATYQRTMQRNRAYYTKFPQDVERVNFIVQYLAQNDVNLPNGGKLTVDRFRALGLTFGGGGGTLSLHNLVTLMYMELQTNGCLSYGTKTNLMNYLGFETNPLYFLFQEAIYINGPGIKSGWSAQRILDYHKRHNVNDDNSAASPFIFTGEIVTPEMLHSHSELAKLAPLANYIHQHDDWSHIYNLTNLTKVKWDTLPCVAQVYLDDQYVDYELGMRNIELFEFKPIITNQLFHDGVRQAAADVIDGLHRVLEQGEYM